MLESHFEIGGGGMVGSMYPHFLWSNLWKNVKEVNLHLKFLLEQEWLEEYTEED